VSCWDTGPACGGMDTGWLNVANGAGNADGLSDVDGMGNADGLAKTEGAGRADGADGPARTERAGRADGADGAGDAGGMGGADGADGAGNAGRAGKTDGVGRAGGVGGVWMAAAARAVRRSRGPADCSSASCQSLMMSAPSGPGSNMPLRKQPAASSASRTGCSSGISRRYAAASSNDMTLRAARSALGPAPSSRHHACARRYCAMRIALATKSHDSNDRM
jgi:hypothetical protein